MCRTNRSQCAISGQYSLDQEITLRTSKASAAKEKKFHQRRLWRNRHVTIRTKCIREIMNISWKDKITNKVILEKVGLPLMADILIQMNLRCLGHVERMNFARLPRQLLYCQSRWKEKSRHRLRFNDILKRNLKRKNTLVDSWRQRIKDGTT